MAAASPAADAAEQEYFLADSSASPATKGDIASLAYPIFALSVNSRVRSYDHDGVTLTIKPGVDGCATVKDKDLWIYCISQLMAAKNSGNPISRTVRFRAYDFFVRTRRATRSTMGGHLYDLLGAALARLKGTVVETNIATAGVRRRAGFGLIDSFTIIERNQDGRMTTIEVTLPEWLYGSVLCNEVLTLSPEYFQLRKALDRRIYELARKFCGRQPRFQIRLLNLYARSGSTDNIKKFRAAVRALARAGTLPGYSITHDRATDLVTIYSRTTGGSKRRLADILAGRRGSGVPRAGALSRPEPAASGEERARNFADRRTEFRGPTHGISRTTQIGISRTEDSLTP